MKLWSNGRHRLMAGSGRQIVRQHVGGHGSEDHDHRNPEKRGVVERTTVGPAFTGLWSGMLLEFGIVHGGMGLDRNIAER